MMKFEMKGTAPTAEEIQDERARLKNEIAKSEKAHVIYLAVMMTTIAALAINYQFCLDFIKENGFGASIGGLLIVFFPAFIASVRSDNEKERNKVLSKRLEDLREIKADVHSKEIHQLKALVEKSDRLKAYFANLQRPPVYAEYEGARWVVEEESMKANKAESEELLKGIVGAYTAN
jgi:hypothetical protein